MLNSFTRQIHSILDTFVTTQESALSQAASAIADRIAQGGILYVVGSGHSHMIGEEFYARAGGLACIRSIAPMELTLGEHPMKSTMVERSAEYARVILTQYKITVRDIVMIVSNSGRNALPVELALELKRRGIPTIAFTSLSHSRQSSGRHSSGLRLFEICDYVIDNCGCPGTPPWSFRACPEKWAPPPVSLECSWPRAFPCCLRRNWRSGIWRCRYSSAPIWTRVTAGISTLWKNITESDTIPRSVSGELLFSDRLTLRTKMRII